VAVFSRNRWQLSAGMAGKFQRIGWQVCGGIYSQWSENKTDVHKISMKSDLTKRNFNALSEALRIERSRISELLDYNKKQDQQMAQLRGEYDSLASRLNGLMARFMGTGPTT